MNLNCKIRLNDNVLVQEKEGKTILSCGEDTVLLSPIEQMIFRHHSDYQLAEICVILREFYQMSDEQAKLALEEFEYKLDEKKMIDVYYEDDTDVLELGTLLKRNPEIEFIEDEDGTGILRNYKKGQMIYINKTGVQIWKLFEQPRSIDNVVNDLLEIYNITREQLATDITLYVNNIFKKQYLLVNGTR